MFVFGTWKLLFIENIFRKMVFGEVKYFLKKYIY